MMSLSLASGLSCVHVFQGTVIHLITGIISIRLFPLVFSRPRSQSQSQSLVPCFVSPVSVLRYDTLFERAFPFFLGIHTVEISIAEPYRYNFCTESSLFYLGGKTSSKLSAAAFDIYIYTQGGSSTTRLPITARTMRPSSQSPNTSTFLLFLLSLTLSQVQTVLSQGGSNSSSGSDSDNDSDSNFPKRGLCYIATSDAEDDSAIFTQSSSPLTWYYNYSPWPGPGSSLQNWATQFVPMIHSADGAADSVDTLYAILNGSMNIPVSSAAGGSIDNGANQVTHVLTFNEPDGDTSGGGTDTSASDAAEVWLSTLAPLRAAPYNLQLSLPATTGSSAGLAWLAQFNTSCHRRNPGVGCEFDFVATHWYGDFAGLASWIGQIHALYPRQPIWLTEFALPAQDDVANQAFLNQSLAYLDGLNYVEKYAWFGSFREDDANEWTGDGVSLLDRHGDLTQLGATWLGGAEDGFEAGQGASGGGSDNGAGAIRWDGSVWLLAGAWWVLMAVNML